MARSTPIAPFLAACSGVALFSVMDAVMKGLALDIGAYNALLWRCMAGALMGAIAMLAAHRRWPARYVLRIHLLRGTVVTFMALSFFWGIARVPLAEALALSFIAPLIALYLAALLLKERIGRGAMIASVLGLAGVVIILAGKLQDDYDREALWGAAAILFSAILFAYNLILQRQQAQLASPIEIAFFQNMIVMVILAIAAPLLAVVPRPEHVLPIGGAALLAFGSLLLLSWAYARAEAQILIPIEYTAFIWAAILGWLMFREPLTITTLAGAALIVAGCILAARRTETTPFDRAA
jgi:S-adenosylmethionine uptake transporter